MSDKIPESIRIKRPAIEVEFVPTSYKRGKRADAGDMYPALSQDISLADLIKYFGDELSRDILMGKANLFAQNWFELATTRYEGDNEFTKPFDEAEFIKYASEVSARGLSKDEIMDAVTKGIAELGKLYTNMELSPEQRQEKAAALAVRLQSLQGDLAARSRKKKEDTASN